MLSCPRIMQVTCMARKMSMKCINFLSLHVDLGGLVVIILSTESEVRGFKAGRGRWIFLERKNPEYDFLRKGSKAVGSLSQIYGT